MVSWSEKLRAVEPDFFCAKAVESARISEESSAPVWIVSDLRRKSDVVYFQSMFGSACQLITVRVDASLDTRANRKWSFQPGIDDCETECGLDTGVDWDFYFWNDTDEANESDQLIRPLIDQISFILNKLQ